MAIITSLNAMSVAALTSLHNAAVLDYAPTGIVEVGKFASKAKAIAALADLCHAGSLAIEFTAIPPLSSTQ